MNRRCVPLCMSTLTAGLMVVQTDAAVAAEVFTPDHVAKTRAVVSARIAPDGRHIAYVVGAPRRPYEDENGPAWTELHVVDANGNSRPYVTGEVNVSAVRWTPAGDAISFLAKRGDAKHKSLYVIALNGGEARKILSHKTDITSYDWSPDGRRAAFLAKDEEPKKPRLVVSQNWLEAFGKTGE